MFKPTKDISATAAVKDDLLKVAEVASRKKAGLEWVAGKFDEEERGRVRSMPESDLRCPDCGDLLRIATEGGGAPLQKEYYACLRCESVFENYPDEHSAAGAADDEYTAEVDGNAIVVKRRSDGAAIQFELSELGEAAIELAKKQPAWTWG